MWVGIILCKSWITMYYWVEADASRQSGSVFSFGNSAVSQGTREEIDTWRGFGERKRGDLLLCTWYSHSKLLCQGWLFTPLDAFPFLGFLRGTPDLFIREYLISSIFIIVCFLERYSFLLKITSSITGPRLISRFLFWLKICHWELLLVIWRERWRGEEGWIDLREKNRDRHFFLKRHRVFERKKEKSG